MTVQSLDVSAIATTPLGAVSLQVSGSSGMTIEVAPAEIPELPDGMAVDGVTLICVRLATPISRELPVRVRVTFGQDGDPETGQFLDSIAFSSDAGVLQVAMRDNEWLAANGVIAEPVQYELRGFSQTISQAPAGTAFYVGVTWRVDKGAAAANDASAWFAADLALPG